MLCYEFLQGQHLHLSGDGRCDSPGYSAKYCSYSLMDSASDLILDYKLIQSSETGSSVAMEKEGLRRCLNYLLDRDVSIDTIATDRHRGVGALIKSDYPSINHQYDVWHLAKSVVKQLTQKGKQRKCEFAAGHKKINRVSSYWFPRSISFLIAEVLS